MPNQNHLSLKNYFIFVLATIFLVALTALVLVFVISKSNHKSRIELSQKEAVNIEKTISESFSYCNKISSYVGKQIAQHGSNDLQFILKIFRQTDEEKNRNSQLLSWSSFDFVAPNNLQLVNGKVGVRKDPPDMSERQYCIRSKEKPWSLQVSFPVFGNPSGSWVIPVGTGITDDKGKYLGIIVVGIDIFELTALVEKRLISQSSFVVLDENQNIIIQSKDAETDNEIYRKKLAQFNFKEKSGIIFKDLTIGKIKYFYYQKFDDYPYIVLTGFNKVLLEKEFNNSVLPIVGGSVIITFFFLMILYLFKARILLLIKKEIYLQKSLLKRDDLINSKTRLIRAVSHDLKNYIFGISGLSHLILQGKNKSEIEESEDLKMVEELHHQSEELMGFVEDLLDTNQNQAGEFSLGKKQVCNVVDLVKRMIILNKNFALENRIDLEFDNQTKHKVVNVECDVRRLKQVLNNIISNAVKYSNSGSVVILQITLLEESGEVCIAAIDQGIGMSEDEIKIALLGNGEKITKNGLNKSFDSHGLGIPIIKKLIELHRGRLEINSAKGYGTEIKIYLATYDDNKNTLNEEIYQAGSINNKFKNKAALIAEDNAITNKVITFLLRKMGFNVKHVENGEEILEQLDKQHFDLVFLDINMPKLGGFETAKTIREGKNFKRFKNHNIPIIAVSTEKQELSNLKLHGINMLLGKPFSEKELIDFVMGCMN
ncbi:MAG: response regulator [Rickettsiales bacterium]|nr:response regulator [Rickettsiales bacterium]